MNAFIFPGQGSQKLNMLADFYDEAVIGTTFDEASDALGYDLFALITEDNDRLNQTEFTQPAILAASIALYRLFQDRYDLTPDLVAGHSLGEYSALVVAGVLHFQDALKLVKQRGHLMQAAVPAGSGAMAAILGLADADVVAACQSAAQGEIVAAVNFNSPGQVVIAGEKEAVARAIEACKARGAKRALPLPVSVPSHCALMEKAAESLQHYFASVVWHNPLIPVVHNVDAKVYPTTIDIEVALVNQLHQPVQWVQCIEKLAALGATRFIECGPGKVLTGLNKRILPESLSISLEDRTSFEAFGEL